jgi:hypothetical protein
VISLVMALRSFVESAPRAYRLKVGNAALLRNSTEPGTSPGGYVDCFAEPVIGRAFARPVGSQ